MLRAILYVFISAGIFMKKAREDDPEFTYKTYLMEIIELLGKDAQKHDIAVSPVANAARELASSDKWLEKVGQQVVLF